MAEANNDILGITLKVGGQKFPMNIKRADEYTYREAEKLLNKRYTFYANRFPSQSNERYLIMTLLDIAVSYKRLEEASDSSNVISAVEELVTELENQLK